MIAVLARHLDDLSTARKQLGLALGHVKHVEVSVKSYWSIRSSSMSGASVQSARESNEGGQQERKQWSKEMT